MLGRLVREHALDCTSLSTDCTAGTCANGTCQAQPINTNGACDDGITACDSGGRCNASGACVGTADACGALAASCSTCTSGPNCYNGRLCVCQTAPVGTTPIVLVNGVCKLAADECAGAPCAPNAACHDPTPDGTVNGDVQCTCPTGYEGDGKVGGTGCTDINECNRNPNPCGTGAASCNGTSPPGSYSCTCAAGFTAITTPTGPTCVCDLSGTYALLATSMVTWPTVTGPLGIQVIEASPTGGVATYQWSLRHHKIESNGSLTVQTVACGGTAPDLCDVYNFVGARAVPIQSDVGKVESRDGHEVRLGEPARRRAGRHVHRAADRSAPRHRARRSGRRLAALPQLRGGECGRLLHVRKHQAHRFQPGHLGRCR